MLVREPLLVRSCSAFVNNLPLILKTAFIVATIGLVHEIRDEFEARNDIRAGIELAPAPRLIESEPSVEPYESVVTDRVLHFLNCTYEDYRTTHYEECTEAPSRIYQRPQARPDDMGNLPYDMPVRLARLDDYTTLDGVRENCGAARACSTPSL